MQKGHQVLVNEQWKVEFQIETNKDQVLCDVMPMDACHVFLGRPSKFDKEVVYDGRSNTITFEKDGIRNIHHPLKDDKLEEKKVLLVGGKEFLHQRKDTEVSFVVIGKPNIVLINTIIDDMPDKVQDLLNENMDIIVDGFPNELSPIKSISHHIDLIPESS